MAARERDRSHAKESELQRVSERKQARTRAGERGVCGGVGLTNKWAREMDR